MRRCTVYEVICQSGNEEKDVLSTLARAVLRATMMVFPRGMSLKEAMMEASPQATMMALPREKSLKQAVIVHSQRVSIVDGRAEYHARPTQLESSIVNDV
mmetsp:Transcript_17947/g.28267  ORF Transcript_17947/g.28267 Transcript_17947/m.28267 type:complete len:100 (+) Transcript_17947:978-1277(+)